MRAFQHRVLGRQGFRIHRVYPGMLGIDPTDQGLGPLGLFDHAHLNPGLVVPMHQHRNDEIFSYLRYGTLWHEDTSGGRTPLSSKRMLMMNSGTGISHEESIPLNGSSVEMLQIFLRPYESNLKSELQILDLSESCSTNTWRPLVVPQRENNLVNSGNVVTVRSGVSIYDMRLKSSRQELKTLTDKVMLLYVFSGQIALSLDFQLSKGDLAMLPPASLLVIESELCDLILFEIDMSSRFSREGTLSGDR